MFQLVMSYIIKTQASKKKKHFCDYCFYIKLQWSLYLFWWISLYNKHMLFLKKIITLKKRDFKPIFFLNDKSNTKFFLMSTI